MAAARRRLAADYLDDIGYSIARRLLRNTLLGLVVASGIGLLVFGTALSTTTAVRVANELDELAATEVEVAPTSPSDLMRFEGSVDEQLLSLPGVVDAGRIWEVQEKLLTVGDLPIGVDSATPVRVFAVSPGAWRIVGGAVEGEDLTRADFAIGSMNTLLGAGVLAELPTDVQAGARLGVSGESLELAGIVTDTDRHPELLFAIIVPDRTAARLWPTEHDRPRVVIEVVPGGASVVAAEAPLVIDPFGAQRLRARHDQEPEELGRQIRATVGRLPAVLAFGLLAAGAFAMSAAWYASVLERRSEIGLRRALGATGGRIALLVIGETTIVGAVASLVGAVVALGAFSGFAAFRSWTPVLPANAWIASVAAGTLTSVLAGVAPAIRAARLEPADALRS